MIANLQSLFGLFVLVALVWLLSEQRRGMKSLIGGTLATMMTGAVAGMQLGA